MPLTSQYLLLVLCNVQAYIKMLYGHLLVLVLYHRDIY